MSKSTRSPDIASISAASARWVARRDAGLSAAEQRELSEWLAADPRHAAALEHYARTWSVFDRRDRDDSIGVIVRAVSLRRQRRRRRIGAGAAALVVMALSSLLWPSRVSPRLDNVAWRATTTVVRLPESRTLSDGSVVELKSGAVIAVDYSGPLRRVTLQKGEAHFQVAKDKARAFVVSAGGVEARAVGTAFSVDLGSKSVEVLVTEGRVAVSHELAAPKPADPSDDSPAASAGAPLKLLVDAGRRVVVETNAAIGPQPVVTDVALSELVERLAWRSARLEFTGTPLAEAVTLMNRSGGRVAGRPKITLVIDPAAPGLAAEPVSGLFRADNAEAFVRMLEISLGVQTERRGENEVVLRKAK